MSGQTPSPALCVCVYEMEKKKKNKTFRCYTCHVTLLANLHAKDKLFAVLHLKSMQMCLWLDIIIVTAAHYRIMQLQAVTFLVTQTQSIRIHINGLKE